MAASILLILQLCAGHTSAKGNDFWSPWWNKNSSLVLDAYAYTPINWAKLKKSKKLTGFINKASDGLSPPWRCGGNATQQDLCKVKWRRFKAEQELFYTRRHLAKALGLKWGSYHLARPGNPAQQALHYLEYADPAEDDLIALDIEHNDPKKWMSLKDAEIFAQVVKRKIGRYPMLYTNHDTARFIAANKKTYPLLSRLNLWYARYNKKIPGVFPMGHWKSYALWQFSSMHNCNRRRCLLRVPGTTSQVDVNVAAMSPKKLRAAWPFSKLQPAAETSLLASYDPNAPKTIPIPKSRALALAARSKIPSLLPKRVADEPAIKIARLQVVTMDMVRSSASLRADPLVTSKISNPISASMVKSLQSIRSAQTPVRRLDDIVDTIRSNR